MPLLVPPLWMGQFYVVLTVNSLLQLLFPLAFFHCPLKWKLASKVLSLVCDLSLIPWLFWWTEGCDWDSWTVECLHLVVLHPNIFHTESGKLFSSLGGMRRSISGGVPEIWDVLSPFLRQADHSGCRLGPYRAPGTQGSHLMGHLLFILCSDNFSPQLVFGCYFWPSWKVDVWPFTVSTKICFSWNSERPVLELMT